MSERAVAYRRVFAVGVLIAMVASGFVFVFQGSEAASGPAVPQQGKILRIANQDEPKGLNPYAVNDVWSADVIYNSYDGLVNRDWQTQKIQPWIAVGWGVDTDQPPGCDTCNITVEYKLGDWENKWGGPVYFHDGQKVTMDDIWYSYGMTAYNPRWYSSIDPLVWMKPWSDPPYGDPQFMQIKVSGQEAWLGIKKANEHSFQFRLSKPYADFFEDTISTIVFPKHIWVSEHEDMYDCTSPVKVTRHIDICDGSGDFLTWNMDYNDADGTAAGLIGSGPFVFNKWVKNQYSSVKRFDNYFDWTQLPRVYDNGTRIEPEQPAYDPSWTKNHPTPYIDEIVFKIYRTTEAAALAIDSGEVDYVAWSIPPSMVADLQKNPNIQLWYTAEPGFFYTAFNMRRRTFGYEDFANGNLTDVGKPFRKAVAYSTDKGAIVTQLLQGYGKAALGPVSPDNKIWHNDSLPAYGVNEALANQFLDNAGWTDTDGDGFREFPDIGDSQIIMLTPEAAYDPIRAVAGQMIATQAQKVGINLISQPTAFGEIVNKIQQHDYQVYILGWRIGGTDPGYLYNFFHCSQVDGQNYEGYCNPVVDQMLDEYRSTFDKTRRIQLVKDVQGILVEDLPYNVLYYRTNIEASRKDTFVGWVQGSSGIFTGWSLLLIDSPKTPMLTNFVDNRDKIVSQNKMDIKVQVIDKVTSNPISDADLTLKVESGPATLEERSGYPAQGSGTTTLIGKTDVSGIFLGTFVAGNVSGNASESVTLSAVALKSGYSQDNTATFSVEVLPVGSKAISIVEFKADPDALNPGDSSALSVLIVDQDNTPVSGATVVFTPPSIGSIDPETTTTGPDGRASATYSLPKEADVPADGMTVTIKVDASATISGVAVTASQQTKDLTLTPASKPPETAIPGVEAAILVLTVIASAAVFTAIYTVRRRRA